MDPELAPNGGVLGIVGTSPRGLQGPFRADRWARFQEHAGELESAPAGWWAGHAACQAFLNGVSRVEFAGVTGVADAAAMADAAQRLLAAAPLDALVLPGLTDPVGAGRVVAGFSRWQKSCGVPVSGFSPTLWLDAPAGDVDSILAHRAALDGDPDTVRLVVPAVPTLSPGRRQYERLPASCLVAPLSFGCAAALRGVHEPESPYGPDELAALHAARVAVLVPSGVRRQVAAAFPLPIPKVPPLGPAEPVPDELLVVSERIQAALDQALVDDRAAATSRPTAARLARAVLERFKSGGEIAGFTVRCDEETCEGSDRPVVEVGLVFPQRVREVKIRMGSR
jgi:hypothetical protein